jgi:hypothetical protein
MAIHKHIYIHTFIRIYTPNHVSCLPERRLLCLHNSLSWLARPPGLRCAEAGNVLQQILNLRIGPDKLMPPKFICLHNVCFLHQCGPLEPKTPGWLVQDPTTSPSGDLIPTTRGSGAHPGGAGTREEPGTLTQGGALFSWFLSQGQLRRVSARRTQPPPRSAQIGLKSATSI